MKLLAIDPGTTKSAYVIYDTEDRVLDDFGIRDNADIFEALKTVREKTEEKTHFIIEMIKSYGNVMGDSVLETCVWIGRFIEAWGDDRSVTKINRKTVVSQLCRNSRDTDTNVRQALIDRFGGEKAVGKKKTSGPLYGIKKDMWSALALAVAYTDMEAEFDFLD